MLSKHNQRLHTIPFSAQIGINEISIIQYLIHFVAATSPTCYLYTRDSVATGNSITLNRHCMVTIRTYLEPQKVAPKAIGLACVQYSSCRTFLSNTQSELTTKTAGKNYVQSQWTRCYILLIVLSSWRDSNECIARNSIYTSYGHKL